MGHGEQHVLWKFSFWFAELLTISSYGNRYLLVALDRCSKFLVAKACKKGVCNFILQEIVVKFGLPARIISDRGTSFMSNEAESFLKLHSIKHVRTTAYNPQVNGQVERYEGTLKQLLGMLCNDWNKKWNAILQLAACLWWIR